ncbi:FUN14 domain-containing protein 2-like isoform X2 [Diorhabda carinulata]|uniref:FUN14 domain-containing protein 2-like isoform X2 n=1 Tax=Diorhabda carinulata TaxID=1163345 RepID=UPI0025A306E4|nr:FUN14 domain-containing protein 2-like isoform X2 [Diorhabda carinulata]
MSYDFFSSERRPISGKDIHKAANDTGSQAKSFIQSIFRDISKTSATKQIILGASSGWITGFVSMKVGKTLALALGGGIILLQVANEKGYIRINWNKVNKKLDKVVDKVEEQITGETSSWTDKAERFLDRKLDQAEEVIRKGKSKANKWYSDSNYQVKEIHIFLVSFIAGVAIGIATS